MGVYRAKRVSLAQDQLVEAILQAFKRKSQYQLKELVDMLNHPVQPLKACLIDLCQFKTPERVYEIKQHLLTGGRFN